jgi:AraC family transcriptional activator of tynA and feaB
MTTMLRGGDFAAVPELRYEEWRAVVRSIAGRWNPEGIDPNAFAGRVQVRSRFGLCADLFDLTAHRVERTQQDVRLDDIQFY